LLADDPGAVPHCSPTLAAGSQAAAILAPDPAAQHLHDKTPDPVTHPAYTRMVSCRGPEQHPYVTPLADRNSAMSAGGNSDIRYPGIGQASVLAGGRWPAGFANP